MKQKTYRYFALSAGLAALFAAYTFAVMLIDVQPIGPQSSTVGFAALNGFLHRFFGVNMLLYTITDWASIAALLIAFGFGVTGLVQLVRRKSLAKVDSSILVLGGFYLLVILVYVFFELNVVNYRPVLIGGFLEASYPSSTTMLVMCIMPTAMMQLGRRISAKKISCAVQVLCAAFTVFMVGGRLASGVHWFTDILGGALLSAALVTLYAAVTTLVADKTGSQK
ncbi:MAG: phosphatase PAP2 family protein [Oscillospiraceae bacterium]|nr:phosphatase PAP2 family protein [Oscillospiraceae bacterium]